MIAFAALVVTLLVAGVVSFYASSSPDGLEHVSQQQGFDRAARDSGTASSPLADYSAQGVDDSRLSGGLAGVIGVIVVLAIAAALFWLLRRRAGAGGSPDARGNRPAATGQGH